MTSKRRFYLASLAALMAVVLFWLSTSGGQDRQRYGDFDRPRHGIQTQIYATPEYRTDAGRAIDAYERTMERYMDATERNFVGLSADVRAVAVMVETLNANLARLDMRLERIERHLGIVAQPAAPDPNAPRSPVPPAPAPLYPRR